MAAARRRLKIDLKCNNKVCPKVALGAVLKKTPQDDDDEGLNANRKRAKLYGAKNPLEE